MSSRCAISWLENQSKFLSHFLFFEYGIRKDQKTCVTRLYLTLYSTNTQLFNFSEKFPNYFIHVSQLEVIGPGGPPPHWDGDDDHHHWLLLLPFSYRNKIWWDVGTVSSILCSFRIRKRCVLFVFGWPLILMAVALATIGSFLWFLDMR